MKKQQEKINYRIPKKLSKHIEDIVQDGTIDEEINDNKNAKKVDIAVVNGNKKISFKYVWASIFFIATIIVLYKKHTFGHTDYFIEHRINIMWF